MIKKIDKSALIKLIIEELTRELNQAITAANVAHADAVDDQSVAETQYDTLAIEAGYLAEGQSKRVAEFQQAIAFYNKLVLRDFTHNTPIALSALVQLSADTKENHYFFIAPAAGGFRCQLKQDQTCLNITVITPSSPMALTLLGKQQDDDIEIMLGTQKLSDYISKVC